MISRGLTCFKAYDIRGRVPEELNSDIAYRIGRAYAELLDPGEVVVGYDVRLTSGDIASALAKGINDSGADVIDIGLCGTEEIYFQAFHRKVGGGIMVTASHNPMDYNGMKLVRRGSMPVSGDSGLHDIRSAAENGVFVPAQTSGKYMTDYSKESYIQHLLSYLNTRQLKPFKIVVNAGNGSAGIVIDMLAKYLPFEFIRINHEPDGTFPNGIPNPLLPENRAATSEAVIKCSADLGIAWDGDFDRCFFFDENGRFIEGYYIVGMLAKQMLVKHPGSKIIHDPRLTWNTIDIVKSAGGIPVMSKTGHAFIKERMRAEDALYGGEMSSHHYFRDFAYCDSGMIPWLLVAELMSRDNKKLSALVDERMQAYPCSGEINYTVEDAGAVLDKIKEKYKDSCTAMDHTDGLSMEFTDWRFNIRLSNTEPLLRLNIETRGDAKIIIEKFDEIEMIIC